MGMRRGMAAVVALAACGGYETDNDPIGDGDRNDPPLVEGANAVRVWTLDEPLFIEYRNGDGGWGAPEQVELGEFELFVDTYYTVVMVCDGYGAVTTFESRTFADGDFVFMPCDHYNSTTPPRTVTVDMPVFQPGRVWLGDTKSSSASTWTYSAEVSAGVHDMIALDTMNRIAIRRDIDLDESRTLDPLDFDAHGVAMEPHPFAVHGDGSLEELSTSFMLITGRQYASVDFTGSATMYAPPASMLAPGDSGTFSVDVPDYATGVYRSVWADIATAPYDFNLPPIIERDAIVYSVPDNKTLRGDIDSLPAFDDLYLSLDGYYVSQRLHVSRSYFEATGGQTILFTTPPLYLPYWRVDLRQPYYRDLSLWMTNEDGTQGYTSRGAEITNVLGN